MPLALLTIYCSYSSNCMNYSNLNRIYRTITSCSRSHNANLFINDLKWLKFKNDIFCLHRHSSSTSKTKRSLYDILGVTPKATASQIKLAYYELSKSYHPDHYKGGIGDEEGSKKFREITEAYKVLGNLQKKRLYDKGLYNYTIAASPDEAEAYASVLRKSKHGKSNVTPATGHTPVYDFDDWSKEHYTKNLADQQNLKKSSELRKENKAFHEAAARSEKAMFLVLIFAFTFFALR